LSLPNRSSIFSLVDDVILLDMPPPASLEHGPRPASLQARGRAPSPRIVPIEAEPPFDAPSRTETADSPACKYPGCGRQTWAPFDFCGNTHAMMAGAKPLTSTHAARGIHQTHTWDHVTKRCTSCARTRTDLRSAHSANVAVRCIPDFPPPSRRELEMGMVAASIAGPATLRVRSCLTRLRPRDYG